MGVDVRKHAMNILLFTVIMCAAYRWPHLGTTLPSSTERRSPRPMQPLPQKARVLSSTTRLPRVNAMARQQQPTVQLKR